MTSGCGGQDEPSTLPVVRTTNVVKMSLKRTKIWFHTVLNTGHLGKVPLQIWKLVTPRPPHRASFHISLPCLLPSSHWSHDHSLSKYLGAAQMTSSWFYGVYTNVGALLLEGAEKSGKSAAAVTWIRFQWMLQPDKQCGSSESHVHIHHVQDEICISNFVLISQNSVRLWFLSTADHDDVI